MHKPERNFLLPATSMRSSISSFKSSFWHLSFIIIVIVLLSVFVLQYLSTSSLSTGFTFAASSVFSQFGNRSQDALSALVKQGDRIERQLNGLREALMEAAAAKEIKENSTRNLSSPQSPKRRPQVAEVDCARLIQGDVKYAASIASKRPLLADPPPDEVDFSCDGIRSRILPPRNPDVGYPIAFIKLVYQDYEFLEEQLAATYARENVYCFAPDKKSSLVFHRRMSALSSCLPNVYLSSDEYPLDSAGHFQDTAHIDCLRLLLKRKTAWKYAILLQNNDIIMKTQFELATIFGVLNGTSDAEITPCPGDRCTPKLERSLDKLGLCPKDMETEQFQTEICRKANIHWAKGATQVSLARLTAEYILERMNVTALVKELNDMPFGVDEVLMESLLATEELAIPGGYTFRCLPKRNHFISRHSIWYDEKSCGSRHMRHGICVYGVEDLKMLSQHTSIMANKMLPSFDYAAIHCIAEMLYNRTIGSRKDVLDIKYYENLEQVQYNRLINDKKLTPEKINCTVLGSFK